MKRKKLALERKLVIRKALITELCPEKVTGGTPTRSAATCCLLICLDSQEPTCRDNTCGDNTCVVSCAGATCLGTMPGCTGC